MHGSVAILGILNEQLQNGAAALQYVFTRTLVPASSAPYGYTPPLCLQVSRTGRRVLHWTVTVVMVWEKLWLPGYMIHWSAANHVVVHLSRGSRWVDDARPQLNLSTADAGMYRPGRLGDD